MFNNPFLWVGGYSDVKPFVTKTLKHVDVVHTDLVDHYPEGDPLGCDLSTFRDFTLEKGYFKG